MARQRERVFRHRGCGARLKLAAPTIADAERGGADTGTIIAQTRPVTPRSAPFAWLLVLLAGCEVGPDFRSPAGPRPDRYTEAPTGLRVPTSPAGGAAPEVLALGRDVAGEWWALFRNPALTALVARGVRDNPGLEAARQALANARELTLAQWGAEFPSIAASAGGSTGEFAGAAQGVPNADFRYGFYDAHLALSYGFDVWGAVRRSAENRQAIADAERALLEATFLTLTGNIVTTAINEASLRAQIAAQEELIGFERRTLETVERQFALGGATGTDVALQRATLAQALAVLPPLRTGLATARDALAAYVGATPAEAALPRFTLDELALPATLPLSLPATLLAQRPDVRQADANLHAATAEVGVAIASRLPNVTISSEIGTEAAKLGELFTPGNGLAEIVGGAVQPLFAGGTLLHQQRAAVATMRQQAALWRETALDAFRNVADVLAQIANDAELLQADEAAAAAAARALDLAEMQYRLGGASYLTVLTAEVTRQNAAIALVRAEAARFADAAALFVALGGGWWNRTDVPPPPPGLLRSLLPGTAT